MFDKKNCILVVVAHPDDEVLGCGGTILRHLSFGDEVFIAILGEGITSRDHVRDVQKNSRKLNELRNISNKVANEMGASNLFTYQFPDNRFDSVDLLDIVKIVEHIKKDISPTIIYTHNRDDLNIDHRITLEAVVTATRPKSGEVVRDIYSFEIPSSTEWAFHRINFQPDCFVDIESFLNRKVELFQFYETELGSFPFPRSAEAIRTLAMYRGSTVGIKAAEAFKLIRKVV